MPVSCISVLLLSTFVPAPRPACGNGVENCTLNNCIVYFNDGDHNYSGSTLSYCCTTPGPGGVGNITNEPQFVDYANNNFRLQVISPCIDSGNSSYAQGPTDLDGNPRIVTGIVDLGAYEYPISVGYWAWAMVITNGQTNLTDAATGGGYPNLLKYATGSSPTNADTLAQMFTVPTNPPFSLKFARNTNAVDVTLIVEGANDIANGAGWNGIATNLHGSWGGATNVSESGATNPVTVTVQDFASTATNRYLRLHVTRP